MSFTGPLGPIAEDIDVAIGTDQDAAYWAEVTRAAPIRTRRPVALQPEVLPHESIRRGIRVSRFWQYRRC